MQVSPAKRVEKHIQGRVVAGLVIMVPILITLVVVSFGISTIDGFIRPMFFISDKPWDFPGIGVLSVMFVLYVVGLLLSNKLGKFAMKYLARGVNKIPVVKTVFNVAEQATTIFTADYAFTRVVFLEWPREGMVAIGFVTGRVYSESGDHSLAVVYIPTVPNPTSGNLAFVNEDDLYETDLEVEDALKLVFSGGIVLPESLAMMRLPRESKDGEFVGRFETKANGINP